MHLNTSTRSKRLFWRIIKILFFLLPFQPTLHHHQSPQAGSQQIQSPPADADDNAPSSTSSSSAFVAGQHLVARQNVRKLLDAYRILAPVCIGGPAATSLEAGSSAGTAAGAQRQGSSPPPPPTTSGIMDNQQNRHLPVCLNCLYVIGLDLVGYMYFTFRWACSRGWTLPTS